MGEERKVEDNIRSRTGCETQYVPALPKSEGHTGLGSWRLYSVRVVFQSSNGESLYFRASNYYWRSKGYEEKDGAPIFLRPAYETLIQFCSTIWKAAPKLLSVWCLQCGTQSPLTGVTVGYCLLAHESL